MSDSPIPGGLTSVGLHYWRDELDSGWPRDEVLLTADRRFVALLRMSVTRKRALRRRQWLSGPRVQLRDTGTGRRLWERELEEVIPLEKALGWAIEKSRFEIELTSDRVLVSANGDLLLALDIRHGRTAWQVPLTSGRDVVLHADDEITLVCLDHTPTTSPRDKIREGVRPDRWRKELDATGYQGCKVGIAALGTRDGEFRWAYELRGPATAVARIGDRALVAHGDWDKDEDPKGALSVLDLSRGERLAQTETDYWAQDTIRSSGCLAVVFAEDAENAWMVDVAAGTFGHVTTEDLTEDVRVDAGSRTWMFADISRLSVWTLEADGAARKLWDHELDGAEVALYSPPRVLLGYVPVGDSSGQLTFELATGVSRQWDLPDSTLAGDLLLAIDRAGDFVCFDSITGQERWRVKNPGLERLLGIHGSSDDAILVEFPDGYVLRRIVDGEPLGRRHQASEAFMDAGDHVRLKACDHGLFGLTDTLLEVLIVVEKPPSGGC